MRFPDLLATRRGRLSAFFLLYITEGIPLGFAAVTIATQMRRQGLSAAAIGAFTAAIYLPWAFKWAVGPILAAAGTGLARVGAEITLYIRQVWGAFTESRASLVGLAFAVLPAGAMALGLALAQTLAVDLGFDDDQVASLNLWTTICMAGGCVAGGWPGGSIRLIRRSVPGLPCRRWWSRCSGWLHCSTALPMA